ncbi:peptidoglycan DD-metalloendopeptidase family protein [Fundidesulfovibrio terrae]|uniref:peptidoglycan DD-metalloendopeptidase family protein n=1 Tax=Fundidesulfovibrio terrae TaxID=2922866 RepID=UPI001FAFA22E|nr:peptidoglycan DD-metalloendopeptidase family protein [Fundidesulfovibrio terrae]
MSLTPDIAAQASLATDARNASRAQGLASRLGAAQTSGKAPAKAFGKILESVTPEKAEQAGMEGEALRTLTVQAQNKRMNPGPSEEKKAREAFEGFESVFIGQMIKEMRKTVPKDGLLHSSQEDQYVSMFDEELSKTLTKQGGIGLADFMQRQLAMSATAKSQQRVAGPASQQGLRMSSSDSMAVKADPKRLGQGLRDKLMNALRPQGLSGGQQTIPAPEALKPGTASGGAPSATPGAANPQAPAAAGRTQASSLQGTPSQHLGAPGAQYLVGEDAKLADAQGSYWPVDGEVSSDFGWRKDPFTGQRAWHSGLDIAAPEGTPVRCWKGGTVAFSGQMHGYGNLVVVEHADGSRSFYGHNKGNAVAVGQAVKAGQVLAQVGQTGRATGPHLHFEVRVDDRAVDPSKLGGARLAAAPEPEVAVPVL